MSDIPERSLPDSFERGPLQGADLIGDVTEALHRWILDGWPAEAGRAPRIEEDLSFVPKDREQVLYVYMYRVARNENLLNAKRWRPSHLSRSNQNAPTPSTEQTIEEDVLYERAPTFLNLFYLISVHSRFRSEAERLLGWSLMRIADASHLIYRPHKFLLPSGETVDSLRQPWAEETRTEGVAMQKVSMALVDDLSIGDAINFFTINEAPYRPFLTFRAMCAMRGSLLSGPATQVRSVRTDPWDSHRPPQDRPGGRMRTGRSPERATKQRQIGPPGHGHRPIEDNESED